MMAIPHVAVHNRLLTALPTALLTALLPNLRPVSLRVRETLIAPEAPIAAVWFIESGWVSLVTTLDDGTQAEVGLVGREGMVGLPLIVGIDTAFSEAFVQADGTALQMDAGAFRHALREYPELQALLFRYQEAMHAQVTQTAACNGRHDLEPRLARWLLMAHDRAEGDELQITQEFLALMLCVYRPTVSVAASALQRAGIIRYGRGIITVLDRSALEAASCDCHRAVNRRFEYLLGETTSNALS
jgi:CRP-like cAMP-binding protein